jgi:hypothetical protein
MMQVFDIGAIHEAAQSREEAPKTTGPASALEAASPVVERLRLRRS